MSSQIGILTAGNDSPGLNAAIRAFGKTARAEFGMHLIGFQDGFQGMAEDRAIPLEGDLLSGILTQGGTLLGTSPDHPLEGSHPELTASILETYRRRQLDALICLGGRETQASALFLAHQGLNILTLPRGIDNDLPETDLSIGCDTALGAAVEAIDRVHSTASSHHRILIVEIVGQYSGWLTLGAGLAGGADVILIPEIPYNIRKVADAILERRQAGKRFSIIAVAEGAMTHEQIQFFERSRKANQTLRQGDDRDRVAAQLHEIERQATRGNTLLLANRLESFTQLETRTTILGYLLRGGTPSATDRILATRLGTACAALVHENCFGLMVGIRQGVATPVPLEKVASGCKTVPLDDPRLDSARRVGTCLGDSYPPA